MSACAATPHRILGVDPEPRVYLDPADRRQIITLRVEEQAVEQRLGVSRVRRLAGAHDAIDVDQRVLAGRVLVDRQRTADIGALAVGACG